MSANRLVRRISPLLKQRPWIVTAGFPIWRFFQPRFSVGVVGVVFNAQGHILLVEHAFRANYAWGLPGGWVNRDEPPGIAVQREIREELSMDVEVIRILFAEKTYRNHLDLAFLCHPLGDVKRLSIELLDYGWFPQDQLPDLNVINASIVQEAFTLENQL